MAPMATILSNISIVIVKGRNNCTLKITLHMSELSQITELDNLSNRGTPNLATLHRLASTGPYSSINCGKTQLFWQQFVIYGIICIYVPYYIGF